MTTERMMLRRFVPADADWLAELHGDPAVMRFIDDGRPVPRAVVVADTPGARALVRQAFAVLGADQVVATTMAVNVASRRVLEKAGLTLRCMFFAPWPEYLEGAEHGDVVYRVSGQDWRRLADGSPAELA
jgi:RimJ/RimL family protein N-acetyltransferase